MVTFDDEYNQRGLDQEDYDQNQDAEEDAEEDEDEEDDGYTLPQNETLRYQHNNQGYEIGQYKPKREEKNESLMKNKGTISQLKTAYSEFHNPINQHLSSSNNKNQTQKTKYISDTKCIQEVSEENVNTPQVAKKSTLDKKKEVNVPNEQLDDSEEETLVKGYAGRVQKMKKMKQRMEQNYGMNGKKGAVAKIDNQSGKEVMIETEHGNMMVKGGVDLKKLFLG